jgi:hypothetical protein
MRNYSASTISAPLQTAINRYTRQGNGLTTPYASPAITPDALKAQQGDFNPGMNVALPGQSEMYGAPTGDATAPPTGNPAIDGLHQAIARYYGG